MMGKYILAFVFFPISPQVDNILTIPSIKIFQSNLLTAVICYTKCRGRGIELLPRLIFFS